ncbi:MAG: thiamine-binding protein [Syntrophomonadaceae bacterium]|jgi:uncharacterized protein YqgV (UPF0045/DUF77 family)|nr:thiamine-binding protein [Syntrophomonadaceae bacterium]
MANANLSLQVLPRVPEEQLYGVVERVIEMIQNSGLPYVVGPMETTIEGDIEVLLDLVKRAHDICIAAGASAVMSVVKIDYRPGGVTIDEKIRKYRP